MSKLRRQLSASTNSVVEPKKLSDLKDKTGNVYESIAIIAKRANQINITIKEELHNKLEEFASHTDSLEEIHENKEQIEISRAYERMPNPALLGNSGIPGR
jgi:DNA-directed RNA polymerase subunit K/omega